MPYDSVWKLLECDWKDLCRCVKEVNMRRSITVLSTLSSLLLMLQISSSLTLNAILMSEMLLLVNVCRAVLPQRWQSQDVSWRGTLWEQHPYPQQWSLWSKPHGASLPASSRSDRSWAPPLRRRRLCGEGPACGPWLKCVQTLSLFGFLSVFVCFFVCFCAPRLSVFWGSICKSELNIRCLNICDGPMKFPWRNAVGAGSDDTSEGDNQSLLWYRDWRTASGKNCDGAFWGHCSQHSGELPRTRHRWLSRLTHLCWAGVGAIPQTSPFYGFQRFELLDFFKFFWPSLFVLFGHCCFCVWPAIMRAAVLDPFCFGFVWFGLVCRGEGLWLQKQCFPSRHQGVHDPGRRFHQRWCMYLHSKFPFHALTIWVMKSWYIGMMALLLGRIGKCRAESTIVPSFSFSSSLMCWPWTMKVITLLQI